MFIWVCLYTYACVWKPEMSSSVTLYLNFFLRQSLFTAFGAHKLTRLDGQETQGILLSPPGSTEVANPRCLIQFSEHLGPFSGFWWAELKSYCLYSKHFTFFLWSFSLLSYCPHPLFVVVAVVLFWDKVHSIALTDLDLNRWAISQPQLTCFCKELCRDVISLTPVPHTQDLESLRHLCPGHLQHLKFILYNISFLRGTRRAGPCP